MKIKFEHIYFIMLAFGTVLYAGCEKVKIDPKDQSAPNVKLEIKKGDGNYQIVDETTVSATGSEKIVARCVGDDPQGIKSLKISFIKIVGGCNVKGSVFSGNFGVSPIPEDSNAVLDNNDGTTLSKLLLISEDLQGPFSCDTGLNGKGTPYGEKIGITCEAGNWSSTYAVSKASKTVEIKLQ